MTPILVGDLHARADNLLSILGSNAFFRGLEQGAAAMILLGDAVHPEEEDALARMDSSVLMMDLVFALKLRFPERFFYVVGNHDSFSPEIAKAGVRQSLLWSEHVRAARGSEYHEELARFYSLCPLIACSKDFIACHGGAPRAEMTRELLIGAREPPAGALRAGRVRARGRSPPAPRPWPAGRHAFRRRAPPARRLRDILDGRGRHAAPPRGLQRARGSRRGVHARGGEPRAAGLPGRAARRLGEPRRGGRGRSYGALKRRGGPPYSLRRTTLRPRSCRWYATAA
ncbi:MAG: metallophosphoesterase [Planctomycetes bacterium]|nr:metallophosphoesterase [Planctomycetota bacterium]